MSIRPSRFRQRDVRVRGVLARGVRVRAVQVLAVTCGVAPLAVGPAAAAGPVAGPVAAARPVQVRAEEWWIQRLGLEDAWRITEGAGVKVAVIDTGAQANLPELSGAVLPGTDVSGGGSDGRRDSSSDSHGTVMAELIAARGGPPGSMIGVAPQAQILPVVIDSGSGINDPGGQRTAEAIRWAVAHGADVVNMSYGGPAATCPPAVQRAVWYALDHDVILVAAAGNDGDTDNPWVTPAACPGVIAVGAVDDFGRPWLHTARQDYIDVAAPGVLISAVDKNGRPRHSSGTSDAAGIASGSVALLYAAFPGESARQITARLLFTLRDVAQPGRDDTTGYGIVRPFRALIADVPADAANPVYAEADRLRSVSASGGALSTGGVPGNPDMASEGGGSAGVVAVAAVVAGVLTLLGAVLLALHRRSRPRYAMYPPAGPPPYPPAGPPPYPPAYRPPTAPTSPYRPGYRPPTPPPTGGSPPAGRPPGWPPGPAGRPPPRRGTE